MTLQHNTKASTYTTKIYILIGPKSYDMSRRILRAPVPGGPNCCQSSTPITTLANVLQQWTLTNCALSMDTEYVFLMFPGPSQKTTRVQSVSSVVSKCRSIEKPKVYQLWRFGRHSEFRLHLQDIWDFGSYSTLSHDHRLSWHRHTPA